MNLTFVIKYNRNELINSIAKWLIFFIVFGYPLIVSIPVLFKIPSTPVNILVRSLYFLASMFLIFYFQLKKVKVTLTKGAFFVIIFWFFYSLRLITDISIKGIIYNSSFYVYSMAFGNILIPLIAVIFVSGNLNIHDISKKLIYFVLACNLAILLMLVFQIGNIGEGLFIQRLGFRAAISDNTDTLNPITISFTGEILALLSLSELLFGDKPNKIKYSAFLFLGLLIMVLGASRGPMIGFFLGTMLLFYLYLRKIKKTPLNIAILLSKVFIIFTLLFVIYLQWFSKFDFFIIERLTEFISTGKTTSLDNRPDLYKRAWEQFLENPILGHQYLCDLGNTYPHNIYLESVMALGILGGTLTLTIFYYSIKKSMKLLKILEKERINILIVLFALILLGLTSGSLFTSAGFWIFITLFLSMQFNNSDLPKISVDE